MKDVYDSDTLSTIFAAFLQVENYSTVKRCYFFFLKASREIKIVKWVYKKKTKKTTEGEIRNTDKTKKVNGKWQA